MQAKKYCDLGLLCLTLVFVVVGIFMIYDASYARAALELRSSSFYLVRQVTWAIPGVILMFVTMKVPYWKLRPLALGLVIISIVALSLVLIVTDPTKGAKRWFELGPMKIQPSEFAKLAIIIYLASVLAEKRQAIRDLKHGIAPLGIPVGIVGVLIVKEDMGTGIVLIATAFVMLYVAGAKRQHLLGVFGGCGLIGALFVLVEPYRVRRLLAFVDPFKDRQDTGYQVCQSLISLGSGGLRGLGIGEGRQKLFYLPAEHTDFIFAVWGQEAGWIGTSLICILFLLFGLRGLAIANRTKEPFGRLLATGISVLICSQALLNMLVVTSSVPATGVPLPFISYGGSSLLINLICVGVLLGISRYPGHIKDYEPENRTNRRRNRGARVPRDQYRRRTAARASRY